MNFCEVEKCYQQMSIDVNGNYSFNEMNDYYNIGYYGVIAIILLLTRISVYFYNRYWCVFRGKMLYHRLCDNCKRMNVIFEREHKINDVENYLRTDKTIDSNSNIHNDKNYNASWINNNLMNFRRDASEKCNFTKLWTLNPSISLQPLYKELLKDNFVLQVDLEKTKTRLYDVVYRNKNLDKCLFNTTQTMNKSRHNDEPCDSEISMKRSSNVKRRSSFFSSTFMHPIEELNAEKKKKEETLNDLRLNMSELQCQIRFLTDTEEKETRILEEKIMKNNEMIRQLIALRIEFTNLRTCLEENTF